jgi:hypothetical protein
VMENEPQFVRGLEKSLKLGLAMRDDPLLQQDEIRLVATATQQDVSARYNLG